MTRRLTLAILATVLISVLLAGLGTVLLTRVEDRRATLEDLEQTGDALSFVFSELPLTTVNDADVIRTRLARIQRELRLADAELLVITAQGEIFGQFPDGLPQSAIDVDLLREQGQVSGTSGSIVWSATFAERRQFNYVVLLTEDGSRLTAPIFRWVVLSALAAIGAGALVAWMVGRRMTRPIKAASVAARRISDGDLSTRVAVEADREDELTDLAVAINAMAASLERSRGLERQFLLSVSHDLRTPLTSIRGYAEAIGDGTAPDNARAAEVIRSEAQRLERLVTDLLDLARLDARQFRLESQPTDLAELVPDVAAGFERDAAIHDVAVVVDGPDDGPVVNVDPDRLAQVLANLVQNALKFADSQVVVRYGDSGGRAEIEVADDGPGIASEDLPHVFERLYVAAQTPQRKESGSGLGLAIVKELVEAQGGTVAALPRPTGGTRFVVTLPVTQTSGSSRISTLAPATTADAGNDSTARLT